MAARKRLLQAGVGGAGSAYRHYVDPTYTGDTAIHAAMEEVPEEAWYGSLAWGIIGDKGRKKVKDLAKKGARTAATAATGIGAPLALGFFAKDIYDVGSDVWDSILSAPDTFMESYERHSRKKGGQVKKTKRKSRSTSRSKPRGVGKALRGYGAVAKR